MNRTRRQFGLALAALVAAVGAPAKAMACGFDAVFDGSLGFVHPRSIEVALAVQKAVDEGLMSPAALAPPTPGAAGLWAASEQLKRLGRKFVADDKAADDASNIALLLSEAALWTRYVFSAEGCETRVHANGPEPLDSIVVTDLAVLAALNDGGLAMDAALARRLVIVDSEGPEADEARIRLVKAFSGPALSTANALADRAPWGGARTKSKP
jgi:hypothetical protein